MPQPRGLGFVLQAKVDADHVAATVTIRLRNDSMVYLNCVTVYCFSKNQTSVESIIFGSESVATEQCYRYLWGIRYKLGMMGIPCEGPAYISGDNQSFLANMTILDSTLNKKSYSITYNFIREVAAWDEWRASYVNTHDNEADLLTNLLPYGEKQKVFVWKPFTPYISDKRSGGVCHMGCVLRSWLFISHPKATVDVGQSEPLSVVDHHVNVLPLF